MSFAAWRELVKSTARQRAPARGTAMRANRATSAAKESLRIKHMSDRSLRGEAGEQLRAACTGAERPSRAGPAAKPPRTKASLPMRHRSVPCSTPLLKRPRACRPPRGSRSRKPASPDSHRDEQPCDHGAGMHSRLAFAFALQQWARRRPEFISLKNKKLDSQRAPAIRVGDYTPSQN